MESTSPTSEDGQSTAVVPKPDPELIHHRKFASNLPRNLDIWARRIGSLSYRWSAGDECINYRPFKFYTNQPVPAVLHANRESRAIGRLHYKLSLETQFKRDDGLQVTTRPRIYRNFAMDRICPMGKYRSEPHTELWCTHSPPPSRAVNVYKSTSPFLWPTLVSGLLARPGLFHDEILLYYHESDIPLPGAFEFIEATQQNSTQREWDALTDMKMHIIEHMQRCEVRHKNMRETIAIERGEKVPDGNAEGWALPDIKLVAIVVDGVRS